MRKEGISLTKEKLQVYIDIEHRDALEELKTYLPVEETINDSALMRFIIIDLLNRIRKEELFEKKNIRFIVCFDRNDKRKIGTRSHQNTRFIFFQRIPRGSINEQKNCAK